MTDDEIKQLLKPKAHWGALITTALAVAGAVWYATQYLGDIPKRPEFQEVQKNVTQIRLDQETAKGDIKAINIRLEGEFRSMGQKLDDAARDQHRRR